MAVRACGPRRCHDRHNRRATLVVANYDAICAGHNFRCGRGSTAIFLAPIPFSNMVWVADQRTCQPNTRKPSMTLLPTLSVRIDLDTEARIGPGKIQLL